MEVRRKLFNKWWILVSLFAAIAAVVAGIYLFSSSKVVVPKLVGKRFTQAKKAASNFGLELTVRSQVFSNKYAKGKVIEQEPRAGQAVKRGSQVKVVLSKGKKPKKHKKKEQEIKPGATNPLEKLPVGGGKVICIDAGHQAQADLRPEPIGPGSAQTKERTRGGGTGVATGIPEYRINLDIALKLKTLLEQVGFSVVMTRTTNNVSISSAERAQIANNAGANLFVRIHCDSSSSSSAAGISTLYPAKNQWTSPIYEESLKAAQIIQQNLVQVCQRQSRGVVPRSDITGFNWSKVPVVLIESGFLSNPEEDRILSSAQGQDKVAEGVYQGVLEYFGLR